MASPRTRRPSCPATGKASAIASAANTASPTAIAESASAAFANSPPPQPPSPPGALSGRCDATGVIGVSNQVEGEHTYDWHSGYNAATDMAIAEMAFADHGASQLHDIIPDACAASTAATLALVSLGGDGEASARRSRAAAHGEAPSPW